MDARRPNDLYIVVGLAGAVLLGCVATWVVMDRRMKQEKEELRRELQATLKESIKGAADDMLTKEYVEKKVTEEAGKLLADPPVEEAAKIAEGAADAGVKLGTKTATGVLGAVKENEKEIRDTGTAVGEAARVGIDALLDATRAVLGSGKSKKKKQADEAPPEEEQ